MKKFVCICEILFLMFVVSFCSFADTYETPNVIIGPYSSKASELYLDEENYTLGTVLEIVAKEDAEKILYFVSEYRKGNKYAEENLMKIISKYNKTFAQLIVNYILGDNDVKLLSSYIVNSETDTLEYMKIDGVTINENKDIKFIGNLLWEKIKSVAPETFYKNINCIFIEQNKNEEDLITISEFDDNAVKWSMFVDIRLLLESNNDLFFEYMIYNTIYYYLLKTDQTMPNNKSKRGNYSYKKHYYKDESFINQFYNKFWKRKFKEINIGQVEEFPNEFVNNKASKTVYNDIAITFYDYFKKKSVIDDRIVVVEKKKFIENDEAFNILFNFFDVKYNTMDWKKFTIDKK